MCLGPEGYWDPQGPDFSNCTSPWVNLISQKLKAGETAAVIARELAEQTKRNLQAGDITYTVKAMVQLVDLLDVQLRNLTPGGKDSAARSLNKLQKRERSCRFYVQAMVETVNNLLQPQAQGAWRELSTGEQLRAATMLLDTVEQGAFVLADNLLKTDIVQENTDNIQLEVARMSTDGNLPDLKFPQTGGQGNSIHLSANTLKQHGRNGEIRIAFVLYKHIGVYLSTENASMKLGNEAMATNYSVIVNSPVITAAINKDSNKVYLSDPVIFTIRHLQQSEENFNPNCSFWSYSKRTMTGYWSTQDCRLLGTNRTHTTCFLYASNQLCSPHGACGCQGVHPLAQYLSDAEDQVTVTWTITRASSAVTAAYVATRALCLLILSYLARELMPLTDPTIRAEKRLSAT
ncbi:Adhesion G protein-coupled receptor L3 [Larimichthys crocea]|uniref:Uncharacterized protein n=1 Tax=Larimichthys crocea TaxID=215358 RepID=A0ACD3Q606_LARCR|nr:Adhesion G protein-coupled receptor L3 [Larimichthys crocea]